MSPLVFNKYFPLHSNILAQNVESILHLLVQWRCHETWMIGGGELFTGLALKIRKYPPISCSQAKLVDF